MTENTEGLDYSIVIVIGYFSTESAQTECVGTFLLRLLISIVIVNNNKNNGMA